MKTKCWVVQVKDDEKKWHVFGPYPNEKLARQEAQAVRWIWNDNGFEIKKLGVQEIEWFRPWMKEEEAA